jgi:tRNA nucleotidyltransferase (CCA-adding enzyme)
LADLQAGLLRVLHDRSFFDDPTRIFRAVRLAVRLDLTIEPNTATLMRQAVQDGALSTVSMDRITHELRLIWQEPRSGKMMFFLDELGALERIHPDLPRVTRALRVEWSHDAPTEPEQRKAAYLVSLGFEFGAEAEGALSLARHLHLDAREAALVRDGAALAQVWPRLHDPLLRPSEVYRLLTPMSADALEAALWLPYRETDTQARLHLGHYLTNLRHVRPILTGDYIRELGIPPGPIYREALRALLEAKLDGELPTREDEERYLRQQLAERGLLPTE